MNDPRGDSGVAMHYVPILVVVAMAVALAAGLLSDIGPQRGVRQVASRQVAVRAPAMAADAAHAKAVAGELVLVDIRTPEEWQATGVPASAYAITVDQNLTQFLRRLTAVVGGDLTRSVALICHSGERSVRLQSELGKAGFSNVFNVPEGMVGGWSSGPGWLKRGLPLRQGVQAGAPPILKLSLPRPSP